MTIKKKLEELALETSDYPTYKKSIKKELGSNINLITSNIIDEVWSASHFRTKTKQTNLEKMEELFNNLESYEQMEFIINNKHLAM